jgi:NADH-quinone oxidoreductase subunit C
MSAFHDLTLDTIRAEFPDAVTEVVDFRDERTLIVAIDHLIPVIAKLRDDEQLRFVFLEDIVADDYYEEFPRFAVNYHLYSLENKQRIRVRVLVDDPDEGPQSLQSLWKIASWLELEVWDLMGIRFQNHPGLRRLFLPEDWQGHPLRKDYPLGYEEVQFTFNYEEIDARKPYAQD